MFFTLGILTGAGIGLSTTPGRIYSTRKLGYVNPLLQVGYTVQGS